MNGDTRESDMNELRDELGCLCRLSISKDSRKKKRFHETSISYKGHASGLSVLANLTTH